MIELFEKYFFENHPESGHGIVNTTVPNLILFRADQFQPRMPLLYDLGLIFILRGEKSLFINDRVIHYDQDNMLIVTSPSPLECVTHASASKPLIGITIRIDSVLLLEVVGKIRAQSKEFLPSANLALVTSVPVDDKMRDAIKRLLLSLQSPIDSVVLAPDILKELLYYAVISSGGAGLVALASDHGAFSSVSKIMNYIHHHYAQGINIEQMMKMAGMGQASFHRAFKQVAGDTPIQYLKKIRLHKAKELLASGRQKASMVAYDVGYDSPSQFSREFKRFFGTSPGLINQEL